MKEKIAEEKEKVEAAAAPISPASSEVASHSTSQESSNVTSMSSGDIEIKQEIVEVSEPTSADGTSVKVEAEEEKIEKPENPVEVEVMEPPKTEEKNEELTPFEELIRVASLLNPKQFELPNEMMEPFPFPGTDRIEPIKNGRRVKNKRLIELDSHGCVPLPAKLCFTCSKSCKRAPLISCDYCSLYFHQDCLDPPMTALPAGRWMCPNHPQHFIVSINEVWRVIELLWNFGGV
jgi:hypothetical protein